MARQNVQVTKTIINTVYNVEKLITAIDGMSAVKRFHGRKTGHSQTVADHSCRTAQLAFFMALEFYKGDVAKANYLCALALFHDFPESLLECDVPTPVKNMHSIGTYIKSAEADKVNIIFPDNEYLQNLVLEVASEDDFSLMKLADFIDMGFFIREELDFGNRTFAPLLSEFIRGIAKFDTKYTECPTANESISRIING